MFLAENVFAVFTHAITIFLFFFFQRPLRRGAHRRYLFIRSNTKRFVHRRERIVRVAVFGQLCIIHDLTSAALMHVGVVGGSTIRIGPRPQVSVFRQPELKKNALHTYLDAEEDQEGGDDQGGGADADEQGKDDGDWGDVDDSEVKAHSRDSSRDLTGCFLS